jgi:hypothetical protein
MILERDYEEAKACLETKASKSILILSGSIIEALLTDYFYENLPAGQTQATILNATLAVLLDFAETEGVITKSEKNLATVIKDYRNLIHPGREVRKKEQFDFETAELAFKILNLLIRKIERKYREKFSFTAQDIINSLNDDWNYSSIYSIVIPKLSTGEKNNLIDLFVDIENAKKSRFTHFEGDFNYEDKFENRDEVKDFVTELKPLLKEETVKSYLKELVISVTSGHSLQALSLYNLFHEDLHLLTEEEQDLVAIYMLSLFSDIFEDCRTLAYEKTYSTIGKYAKSDKAVNHLHSLCSFAIPHFGGGSIDYELDVLEQILNSFPDTIKTDALEKLKQSLLPLEKVPKQIINGFVTPLTNRGLITFD